MNPVMWFNYVEYDTDSILVIISDNPLICISRISPDNPIRFERTLGGLMIRYDYFMRRLQRHLVEGFEVRHQILRFCGFRPGFVRY